MSRTRVDELGDVDKAAVDFDEPRWTAETEEVFVLTTSLKVESERRKESGFPSVSAS